MIVTSFSSNYLIGDTDKTVELDEHTNRIQPSSLTHGVSASHSNIGDQKTSESSDKKELCDNGKNISKYNNQEAPPNGSGELSHTKPTPFTGGVNATFTMPNASGNNLNATVSLKAESNQSALEGVGKTSSRLHASQIRLRDPLPTVEFDRESKKIRIACQFHAKGWCIRGNSCKFLHIKDGSDAVTKRSEAIRREASSSTYNVKLYGETGRLDLPIDDTFLGAPSWEDRGSFKNNLHLDNYRYYGTPPVKGSLSAWGSAYHGVSSTSHDNSHDTGVSGFKPTMDEIIRKKSNVVDPWLADLPYPHSRQPLVSGSSSQNTSAHGPDKFLQSSLEDRAYLASSMKQSSPPASRSQPETVSCNADPAKSEGIFSSFSWEPSVPFRPSHEITQGLLLKENLQNPPCVTTDKNDVKDGRMKFSNSDQGSSIKNVKVQSNSPEKEKLLNVVFAGDTVKDNLLSLNNDDDKMKHDNLRGGAVSGVDGSGKTDCVDDCFKRDDHVQSESKAFKYFQSALIELVKELVKPTWREGLLSKDAHKLIVKKAVDKVLITLQPHQIPSTAESVNLYLTSSQPKLAKLVEGYINIYGKT